MKGDNNTTDLINSINNTISKKEFIESSVVVPALPTPQGRKLGLSNNNSNNGDDICNNIKTVQQRQGGRMRADWSVKASIVAKNTFNPIRSILETMDCDPNPAKKMISLSIGDPTVFGNLKPAREVVEAVHAALDSGKHNGYGPSTGSQAAKEAVARHVSVPGGEVTADDIILCSGCSCSLDITISTLAQDGQNILVPRPGFPLYTTLSAGLG
jgi:DNA-binding transcriptional MocR family regulator